MAKDKKKKPRHSQLVLPGEQAEKKGKRQRKPEHGEQPAGPTDRLGRPLADEPAVVDVIPTAKVVVEKEKPETQAQEDAAGEGAGDAGTGAAQAETTGLSLAPAPERVPARGNTTNFPAVGKAGGQEPAPEEKPAKGGAAGKKKKGGAKAGLPAQNAKGQPAAADEPAGNAVKLSAARARKSKRVQAVKRKKLWRRVRVGVALALVAAVVWMFASGFYSTASVTFSEVFESIQLSMQPGDGFPVPFSGQGLLSAESMGSSAFAALGETDLVMVSSTGRQLRSTPHALSNPALAAGKTRVCVYGRNSTSFRIEGRSEQIFNGNMDQEILFAEMSPGGWLGMCTASNYQAVFRVYSPSATDVQKHSFRWVLIDEKPFMAEFHTDDKHFALACLTTVEGALTTNIHLMHTGRGEKLASIQAVDAVALQMRYLTSNRLLVLFHTYAAIYDGRGEEVARYDYGGRSLYTADTTGSQTALVFGSEAQEEAVLVQLDANLEVVGSTLVHITDAPMVLAGETGTLLMAGSEVMSFAPDGRQHKVYIPQTKPLWLVRVGAPLLLTLENAEDLSDMLADIQPPSLPPETQGEGTENGAGAYRPAGGSGAESADGGGNPEEGAQVSEPPDSPGAQAQTEEDGGQTGSPAEAPPDG